MTRLSVEERRRLLVEAARRVAATQGFSEISTRAVTDEAGMPRGSFHYCFRSKEELLTRMLEQYLDQMSAATATTWDDELSLADNLFVQSVAPIRIVEFEPGAKLLYYELVVHALRNTSGSAHPVQHFDITARATEYLRWVEARVGVTWQRPIDALARMYNAVMSGSLQQWLMDSDTSAVEASIREFTAMLAESALPRD